MRREPLERDQDGDGRPGLQVFQLEVADLDLPAVFAKWRREFLSFSCVPMDENEVTSGFFESSVWCAF
jgi:hypothetical protein